MYILLGPFECHLILRFELAEVFEPNQDDVESARVCRKTPAGINQGLQDLIIRSKTNLEIRIELLSEELYDRLDRRGCKRCADTEPERDRLVHG